MYGRQRVPLGIVSYTIKKVNFKTVAMDEKCT
jgi:hypothetical protein